MEEKKEQKDRFSVVEVPTSTGFVIRDEKTGEDLQDMQILSTILNGINEILRRV